MGHIEAVMGRRIKFILEKQSFISFAFNTHKGENKKFIKSIFPSKTGNKNQILEINKFLVTYFTSAIKNIKEICNSNHLSSRRDCYDKFLKVIFKDLHSELEKKGLCDKFEENTSIFWSYFTKMVNILIYEIITHNELVDASQFHKIKWIVHVPIDKNVICELKGRIRAIKSGGEKECDIMRKMENIEKDISFYKRLDSINSEELYDRLQNSIRIVQEIRGEPPIYIEDAYSLTESGKDNGSNLTLPSNRFPVEK